MGSVGHLNLEVMLDSGASIFLLAQASVARMTNTIEKPIPKVLLKTASGMQLPVVNMSQLLFSYKIWRHHCNMIFLWLVIVKSHYEEVIVVITRVRGGAEDECNNNDNLQVQWDLTSFYPIVFDVRHVMQ